MWEFLASGIVLGLAAGLAPGPLLALVIGETLSKGTAAGIRVAMAPLISDLPIVLGTYFLLRQLPENSALLGGISLAGALFLLIMAYGYLHAERRLPDTPALKSGALIKGVTANLLNPHPYLFWLTAGGILLQKSLTLAPLAPVVFLLGFYLCLVGSKILLAFVLGRRKKPAAPEALRLISKAIGVLLLLLAINLLRDALEWLAI